MTVSAEGLPVTTGPVPLEEEKTEVLSHGQQRSPRAWGPEVSPTAKGRERKILRR